jgi:hypothetical protein
MKLSKPFRFKEGLASLGSSKGSKEVQNKRVEGVQFGPSFLFFDVIYQTYKLSLGPIQTCHVFFGHFSKNLNINFFFFFFFKTFDLEVGDGIGLAPIQTYHVFIVKRS